MLSLLVEGVGDKALAARLGIRASTAEYHVRRLREKLGVRTRAQLVASAVAQGLVPEPSPPPVGNGSAGRP